MEQVNDLRSHLASLERFGLLRHVVQEVDKDTELSSLMRWVYMGFGEEKRFAIIFDNVKSYSIPVVAGAIGASYKTYAVGLGVDPLRPRAEVMKEVRQTWIRALDAPLPPTLVDTGPCKENIITGKDVDIHKFPIPVWTPTKDRNWDRGFGFLTSPYHITKDPETGSRNVGTYRNMTREEPNLMGICVFPGSHIWQHVVKNERNGKPTQIATVLGADPAIGMASTTDVPYGVDELAIAGALRGRPVELVRCETVDLEVPATAEIVIEGRLLPPQERPYEEEAPFGEYTGYEGAARLGPVYEITCITHRNNPIYQAFISEMPPSESSKLRHVSFEALTLRQLRTLGIPGIIDINMPETAQGAVTIVSIRKMNSGHPARVAAAIFSVLQPRYGKFVIVTDDDVDIYDLDNVFWAMAFRTSMAPNRRQIRFIEGLMAQGLDYSATSSLSDLESRIDYPSDGVLIDATRPYKPYPVVSLPPMEYLLKARDKWEQCGLPSLDKTDLPRSVIVEEEYLREGIAKRL
ncbi:MAG: UbiD family decarboxylase [Dehalococcoidia bacterium]|nr:UbiD family decarboxylase [Dehalococcoidia bacterium]